MSKRTTLSLLLLAFAVVSLNATIVRGTITTQTLYGETYLSLDFNNDGIEDFSVETGYDENFNDAPNCYIIYDENYAAGHNIWANGTASEGWDEVKNLALNTSIGSNGNWIGYGDASLFSYSAGAYLPLNTDLYFGFRIGQNNYGWARVTMAKSGNTTTATWHEIYYETTANTPILAGNRGNVGIETPTVDIVLFPNPTSDVANIVGLNGNETIVVCDMNGRLIQQILPQSTETVSINLSSFASGCYIISVKEDGRNVTSMIVNKK
ncbi:MAG: T9SS type A sorting domain-containing protein [Bacteroidales bacterium]|nr:T9SS type A sorting domain-containing protein [Bacteroidales bacterium]